MIALAYIVSLLSDLAMMTGTAYLVGWCGWSPWWFALTVSVCGCQMKFGKWANKKDEE